MGIRREDVIKTVEVKETIEYTTCDYCTNEIQGIFIPDAPEGWAKLRVITGENTIFGSTMCDKCIKEHGIMSFKE